MGIITDSGNKTNKWPCCGCDKDSDNLTTIAGRGLCPTCAILWKEACDNERHKVLDEVIQLAKKHTLRPGEFIKALSIGNDTVDSLRKEEREKVINEALGLVRKIIDTEVYSVTYSDGGVFGEGYVQGYKSACVVLLGVLSRQIKELRGEK